MREKLKQVKSYHQATKHNFNQYAPSLGYLDWANQPDPFRRFTGAPLSALPLLRLDEEPVSPFYEELFHVGRIPSQPLTLVTLSRLFEYALSITAWKEYGDTRWALRSNPSSGNLHPTEGYLFIGPTPGLSLTPGLYHYAAKEHGLEQRLQSSDALADRLLQDFPSGSFLVGLTSVHWREAWKYGERAFRYCQHDIGHAIGTLRIAAASLGWRLTLLTGMADDSVSAFLGINRAQDFLDAEPEFPELVAVVWPSMEGEATSLPLFLHPEAVHQVANQSWVGQANRLSRDNPVSWNMMDEVSGASWKSHHDDTVLPLMSGPEDSLRLRESGEMKKKRKYAEHIPTQVRAGQIIHQRRSALAFDGKTELSADQLYAMLARVMPQAARPLCRRVVPWDAIPWDPAIHLALFIHRVNGIPPGLYFLIRSPAIGKREFCRSLMQEAFEWTRPAGCPEDLPLYLLEEGNVQTLATQLSCGQDIAGESAFSLGMIAEFDETLATYGPWAYRRLFWEAGLIGQVLYLEAEAAGLQATGIGCFFDDPVHRVLGFFPQNTLQSLYHFTIGGPVEDGRLTTRPPYEGRE